MKLLNSTKGSK